MHFDIPQKNCRPKIEHFHCCVQRFTVSKVDLPPYTNFATNLINVTKDGSSRLVIVVINVVIVYKSEIRHTTQLKNRETEA
jgi:hypothetical protein